MNRKIVLLLLLAVLVVMAPIASAASQNKTIRSSNITDTDNQQSSQQNISDNNSIVDRPGDVSGNIICEELDTENPQITPFGELVNTLLYLIITTGGLVAVVFGAGFTMMSAVKPKEGNYVEKRNKAIIFGIGTIIIVYGVNAIVSRFHYSLDFGCALPFF